MKSPVNISLRKACFSSIAIFLLFISSRSVFPSELPPCKQETTTQLKLDLAQTNIKPKSRGFLFEVEKNKEVSWLYGTIHMLKPQWASPGIEVLERLIRSKAVAFEIDMYAPDNAKRIKKIDKDAYTLEAKSSIDIEVLTKLERAASKVCTLDPLSSFEANVDALTLTEFRRQGYLPGLSMEAVLRAIAVHGKSRPIFSLEDTSDIIANRKRELTTNGFQRAMAKLEGIANKKLLPYLDRITEAWATSNATTFDDYFSWCECLKTDKDRDEHYQSHHVRNAKMADSIEKLHMEKNGQVFFAVGVLHLFHEGSIQEFLQKRGFVIREISLTH